MIREVGSGVLGKTWEATKLANFGETVNLKNQSFDLPPEDDDD